MTSAEIIEEIGVRLARAAPRDSRVVLFGSHARGEADQGSDYDILVIEPEVTMLRGSRFAFARSWEICSCRSTSL